MTAPGGEGDFRMAGAYIEVNLKDNTEADERKIRSRIEDGAPVQIKAELDKKSLDDLELKVKAGTKAIGNAAPVTAKLELDAGSVALFESKIKAIMDSTSRSSTVSAGVDSSGVDSSGGSGVAGGATAGGAGIGQAGLIAAGLGLGAGAAGGAALLTAPALMAAIGIAAEKSNTQVATAFTGMESAAKSSLQAGFAPFVPVLVAIADQAKTTVAGMEPDFQAAARATAPLLQAVSTGLLSAVKEGVGGSAPLIQSLGPLAQAAGQGIVQLERGVVGLLQNLDTGQATQGMTALFTAVEQILPAAGSLISTIMPLGNALLTVLGPAVRDTLTDLSALTPVTQAVGGALTALGPDIAAYGPLLLGLMTASKLLTGSWGDFSGAAGKLKSVLQDADGEFDKGKSSLDSLAKTIGINTAATKEAAVADAQYAADKAAIADATAKQSLITAQADVAASNTAKTRIALVDAEKAESAASLEAAAAQKTLAEAEDMASFSFGPLGIAIAGIGALLLPFIGNMLSSGDAANKMTGELSKLQQAASDTQALAHLFQTDPQAEQQLAMLQKYGVTLKDLADANNGDAAAQKKVADAAKAAADAVQAKLDVDQKAADAATGQTVSVGRSGAAYEQNAGSANKSADAVRADKAALADANATYKDAKAQLDATTAAQQAQSAAANQQAMSNGMAAMGVSTLGESLSQATDALAAFLAKNPGAAIGDQFAAITADAVAPGNALQTITDHFTQTGQAAVSAAQSYADAGHSQMQAATAVADANHSLAASEQAVATARQGVVLAERAVNDALANVTIAQNNVTKAEVADQQAVVNLNTARQQTIETLKALHLQLADQATSETSARLALFDQTNASLALGVTSANAQTIAGQTITATNESQIKSANDLLKAQQTLADTLNTGTNLRRQVTAADKAGVDGAPAVIAAQQAIAAAQDQVVSADQALVKAHQAVSDAQANVLKAEQGVTDALYAEGKARQAVSDALYNEGKAAQATQLAYQNLSSANAANSHNLDLNTAAGRANALMQAAAAQQILNSHEPLAQQAADLQVLGTHFGDNQAMANLFYQRLLNLSGLKVVFDVKGVATIDMTQLEQSLYPGSTPSSIAADLKDLARGGSALFHAEGGEISGIGGPRDDLNLAFLSDHEFVQPADSHDYYGTPFMEAIRQKKIPKDSIPHFAGGGSFATNNANIATLLLSGYDDAVGSAYEVGGRLKSVFGFPFKDLPLPPPPSALPNLGGGNGSRATGGSAAQAQAYAASILGQYGWGQDQMSPLIRLFNQESGWNSYAVNPSSGAYGIPQSLGHGHPYNLGDIVAQINWGLNYIKGRYGSPGTAWAHEVANNWYDEGGLVPPGDTLVRNATGRPETMLPPALGDTLNAIHAAVQGSGISTPAPVVRKVEQHYHITQQPREDGSTLAARVSAETSWAMMTSVGG